jgi:hypothetical protein
VSCRFHFFLLEHLCSSTSALTATRTAASCSLADVQAAVNGSVDPNGSATWTGGIATTKQIMIRAQNYVATPNGNVARNVVITNNSPSPLFALTSGNNFHCGVAGIKFVERHAADQFHPHPGQRRQSSAHQRLLVRY